MLGGITLRSLLIGKRQGYDEYECRRCGTSIAVDRETCPNCGSPDVVRIPV